MILEIFFNGFGKSPRVLRSSSIGHPDKMFRFPSPRLLWWQVGRSGKNKKKEWTLEGVWVPEKAGLLSKKPGYKVNSKTCGLFDYQMSKQPLKNVVSMLIKDKDITSFKLLLIKQDRLLVNYLLLWLVNLEFFFFYFPKKIGRSGDGRRNILLGRPYWMSAICIAELGNTALCPRSVW